MGGVTDLAGWLTTLDAAALARVLEVRPDAASAPEPRTVRELAGRLELVESVVQAVRALPLPCVQLLEAAVALGDALSRDALVGFLDGADADAVERWLAPLTERALVWPDSGGLRTSQALPQLFPSPLGLGPPLAVLMPELNVDEVRRMLRTIGAATKATRKAELVEQLTGVLTDPDIVRGLVATAPRTVREELLSRAGGESGDAEDEYDDEWDDFGAAPRYRPYDPEQYRREQDATRWAAERGLVFAPRWGYGAARMSAEVGRALRGTEYRAPFSATPPEVHPHLVDVAQLRSYAAAAVTRFDALALALVDRLARRPLPTLKSGGIGTRELGKLAKELGASEPELRLALELCAAARLLAPAQDGWRLDDAAAQWRDAPAADRMAELLTNWWALPSVPTQERSDEGKAAPALLGKACGSCRAARQNLLTTYAAHVDGAAIPADEIARLALWNRPFVHVLAQDDVPFASTIAEAELLGVLAASALTPIGFALATGRHDELRALLADALPAANDTALFGADLTAVVSGAPTRRVCALLDSAADRESRGGATVWRFSPGSVRRALDDGQPADALLDALAEIASTELPQPLRYLVADIGRQHGTLRVAPAASMVRSDDEALLRQVVADRALRKLGLRQLAPTVLAADVDETTLLAGLRAAGYLPMPEAATHGEELHPSPSEAVRPRTRSATTTGGQLRRESETPDPAGLAKRLLAGDTHLPPDAGTTEKQLDRFGARLSAIELRLLAHAIDTSGSVLIDYRSQSGNITRRVISRPDLFGDSIGAWCELRNDERWFRLDRILSVSPA